MDLEPFRRSPPQPLPGAAAARSSSASSSGTRRSTSSPRPGGGWSTPVPGCRAPHRRRAAGSRRVVSELVADSPARGRVDADACRRRGSRPRSTQRRSSCFPSRGEGMGRVVVEAFCRGRTVVGTDAGGIPDLVERRRERAARARRRRRRARRRSRAGALGSRPRGATRGRRRTRLRLLGGDARGVRGPDVRALVDRGRHARDADVRLVFVTQRVDPDDPVLGATVAKIAALAARFDEVVVLTDSAVAGSLPAELPRAHLRRAARAWAAACGSSQALARRARAGARGRRPCSRTCARSTPCSRRRSRDPAACACCSGTRTGTGRGRSTLAARALERTSISVDAAPSRSGRARSSASATASTCRSSPVARRAPAGPPFELLALGRYSASKGLEAIVRAVGLARAEGLDVRLRCHGPTSTPAERRDPGAARTARRPSSGSVTRSSSAARFRGASVPALLARSVALVNNMRLRRARQGRLRGVRRLPCRCSSRTRSFDELLDDLEPPLRFPLDDATDLAAAIAALGALDASCPGRARRDAARARRRLAIRSDSWADAVVGALRPRRQPAAPTASCRPRSSASAIAATENSRRARSSPAAAVGCPQRAGSARSASMARGERGRRRRAARAAPSRRRRRSRGSS